MKNKNGYLLPMALIFTTITLLVGFSIYLIGYYEQMAATYRLIREKAFYLAEAGGQRAFAHLRDDAEWAPETNWQSLGTVGEFLVTSDSTQSPTIVLTCVGRVSLSSRTVSETVEMVIAPSMSGGGTVFSRGFFGSELVTVGNNAAISSYNSHNILDWREWGKGDIGSNTHIDVGNNAAILGSVAVSTGDHDDIDVGRNVYISGDRDYSAASMDLAEVAVPADLSALSYPVQGDARITRVSGSYTLDDDGNLTMSKNTSLRISGGNLKFQSITISNNSSIQFSNDVRLYVEQDMTVNNNARLHFQDTGEVYIGDQFTMSNGAILDGPSHAEELGIYLLSSQPQTFSNGAVAVTASIYAPLATVTISNGALFMGAVVANQLSISNNAALVYDTSLRNSPPPGAPVIPGELQVSRWRKLNWSSRF